jgi:3-deoxy-D-manno-octulosonic acid kinase
MPACRLTGATVFSFLEERLNKMRAIDAQLLPLSGGGILYDAARIRKPAVEMFAGSYWAAHQAMKDVSGGRSKVSFIRAGADSLQPDDAWVLRHYRRGGMVAALLQDRYLWTGAARTRCFREWRLLAKLYELGLPVPAPVAARFSRSGLTYAADLITVQLPGTDTLASSVCIDPLSPQQWSAIGNTIARFHAQGVHHADLNAHNIVLGTDAVVYLLDFDRGQIRSRGSWERRVLARLQRSLRKIAALAPNVHFDDGCWEMLVAGYEQEDKR